MPPQPLGKLLGRGIDKDGRPTVTDLIKTRESEAALRETTDALRKELADERAKYAKYLSTSRYDRNLQKTQDVPENKMRSSDIIGC